MTAMPPRVTGLMLGVARGVVEPPEDGGDDAAVRVRLGEVVVAATSAVSAPLGAGTEVLLAEDAAGARYVVGVVGGPGALVMRTGVRATLEAAGAGEVLRVTDAAGNVLFAHDTARRVTVVSAPEGDLELRAPHGSVRVVAAESLTVQCPRAEVKVGDARVEGTSLSTTFDRVREAVGVLETRAERILERARNVYREVDELSQTRAGRMRLVADKALHLLGQRTLIKAREDVKVKGEKVYLA